MSRISKKSKAQSHIISYLKEIMRRRKRNASQLAADLNITHASVSRWLTGKDVPDVRSCRRLSEYSGESIQKILAAAGHIPKITQSGPLDWPEFREYARQKYHEELDDDIVTMIEDLIERRRLRRYEKNNP